MGEEPKIINSKERIRDSGKADIEPMRSNTHLDINKELCGIMVTLEKDYSLVRLDTNEAMKVDNSGLIHGGFIFGTADYAAMLAVNHPNVVLGSAEVQFLKPLKSGDAVFSEARVIDSQKRKKIVSVSAKVEDMEVFKGTFTCYVLEKHVLEKS
ncbi:hotdog domain-containing protein [Thermodesulfobacteriota bacterium]